MVCQKKLRWLLCIVVILLFIIALVVALMSDENLPPRVSPPAVEAPDWYHREEGVV